MCETQPRVSIPISITCVHNFALRTSTKIFMAECFTTQYSSSPSIYWCPFHSAVFRIFYHKFCPIFRLKSEIEETLKEMVNSLVEEFLQPTQNGLSKE